MQRYNDRKAKLVERVEKGELEPEQAKLQLGEFTHDLLEKLKARDKKPEDNDAGSPSG